MNIIDYERILDSIPEVGIHVVREDTHEVLYFNKGVREMVPQIRKGVPCDKLRGSFCANCPLRTIGDQEEMRSVSCEGPAGKAVDIVAKRIRWGESTPAFVITVTPHRDETSPVYRKILRVNLTKNSYSIVKPAAEDWAADRDAETFSAWLEQFTDEGVIHPDDMDRFQSFTHLAQDAVLQLQAPFPQRISLESDGDSAGFRIYGRRAGSSFVYERCTGYAEGEPGAG